MNREYGVITLAFGKPEFLGYAATLARSLILHSPHVPRAVVTDAADWFRDSLFDIVIPLRLEYGDNVRQKIHLDKYSPFENSLFIDSDSVVVKSLDAPIDVFRSEPFAIPIEGRLFRGGEDWFIDTNFILDYFGLDSVPKFNSGTIWFTKDALSQRVFDTAREILARSRELRFHDFKRNGPADEPIFAISMALNGIAGVADRGRLMQTPIGLEGKISINSIKGTCRFVKYGEEITPAICHFASFTQHPSYLREQIRLACKFSRNPLLRSCASIVPAPYVFLTNLRSRILRRVRRVFARCVRSPAKQVSGQL